MRKLKPTLLSGLLLILFMSQALQLNATKRALLIAIGDYPADSGWKPINSGNDVGLLQDVLRQQGFAPENTAVLMHESATRMGILYAIRTHLLNSCAPGDEVYFHFSGHGQQVVDDNNDELDGLDEAIVPYDSPMRFQPGVYEGENLIRDEELGELFREIRKKIGPSGQLIIVIDACHSGTGTRGNSIARGTDKIMGDSAALANLPSSRGADEGQTFSRERSVDGVTPMAPVVAFFGAAPNQLNFETKDEQGRNVGSLSYAWSKALSQVTPRTTYRGIFETIRTEMSAIAPRQTPMAEGDLDRSIFGGDVVPPPVYFKVKEQDGASGLVWIDGGWLQGLNKDSKVGFFPPESRDPRFDKPWATGVITQSGSLACGIQMDQPLSAEQLKQSWVYMTEQSPGDLRVKVNLKPFSGPLYNELNNTFNSTPVIEMAPDADLFVEQVGNEVHLITADDQLLLSMPVNSPPPPAVKKYMAQIFAFGRVKFIRNLSARSLDLRLTMEIIPVKINDYTGEVEEELPLSSKTNAAGTVILREGDIIMLRVKNNGRMPAYFNVVDLQPDYVANVIVPGDYETAEEYMVKPGKQLDVPTLFEIGPPYGAEVFKLIAASEAIDLRPVFNSQGTATRGSSSLSPLEDMFNDTFYDDETMTRGGKVHRLSAGTVAVFSVPFNIAP